MFFGSKRKKQQKKLADNSGGTNEDFGDCSSDAVIDKVVAGTINMSKSRRSNGKNDSAVDIIVDSDEDEIFDDEDEDEIAGADDSGNVPSSSLDYRDMLAAGTNPVRRTTSGSSKEDSQRDSYDRSEESEHEEEGDDTDSGEEDKGKGGNGSDSGEDYTDDEDEGEDGYRPGGYHPVKVGEVYNQRYVHSSFTFLRVKLLGISSCPRFCRYVVIKKLGWGHFSTVWMVKDRKAAANNSREQFFALKVQKSAEHYTEAAMDEVELLDCIHKERKKSKQLLETGGKKDNDGVTAENIVEYSQYVATLHDSFFHTGPNGKHMCMVFSMLGSNLLSVIKAYNYRGIPIPVVKNMIRGVCKGLDFLHRKCQIIHTDLKPENVLLHFDGSEEDISVSMTKLTMENSENPVQSIEDLEALLAKDDLTPEERKKLKRKLKKKRQKERRKLTGGDDDDDDEDEDGDEDDDDDDEMEVSSFLSDFNMSQILSSASGIVASRSTESEMSPTTKPNFDHSAFVTANFGHRQEIADGKLMQLLRSSVSVNEASPVDLANDLKVAEKNGGVAEVSFILRAFTPEEELANSLSAALGGIPWEPQAKDKASREW